MRAAQVTKWIHPIVTQHEPDVPQLIAKLSVRGIEMLPVPGIGTVLQLAVILLALIRCVPGHQLGILVVSK